MPKKIPRNNIIGQRGINLIKSFVLEMGRTGHPTTGTLEAGIDGFIELRDPIAVACDVCHAMNNC